MLAVGVLGLQRGDNDDLSGGVATAGLAAAAFGAPIVHLAHGRTRRAGASYLIRSVTATATMVVGLGVGCPARPEGLDRLDCWIPGMMWGAAAGLALSGIADALVLHRDSSRTWVPTMSVGEGGARIGIAAPW